MKRVNFQMHLFYNIGDSHRFRNHSSPSIFYFHISGGKYWKKKSCNMANRYVGKTGMIFKILFHMFVFGLIFEY